jgi:hypothetical protein
MEFGVPRQPSARAWVLARKMGDDARDLAALIIRLAAGRDGAWKANLLAIDRRRDAHPIV